MNGQTSIPSSREVKQVVVTLGIALVVVVAIVVAYFSSHKAHPAQSASKKTSQTAHAQQTSTHSSEWWSGYHTGMEMYQQVGEQGTAFDGSSVPKSPQNTPLVNYCDQSALGAEPNLPDMTQWLDGYAYGCYGGTS